MPVPGYVRIIRESSGLYDGLYVPTSPTRAAGASERVADGTTPSVARRGRPPSKADLSQLT